jgi:DNA-3-methyladenine glycosylase II
MNNLFTDHHLSTGPLALADEILVEGLHFLSDRDRDLADILNKLGSPPMWAREPGFPTLAHIILERHFYLNNAG